MPEPDGFTDPVDPDFPPDYEDQLILAESVIHSRATVPLTPEQTREILRITREARRRQTTHGRKAE